MPHAIRLHAVGGPEQLRWDAVELAAPAAGQVRIRHAAVGLNFIDVYHRTGLYPVPLPYVPGQEGAGVVVEAGPGLPLKAGDRVAYAGVPGAYAEERNIPAERLVRLPESVSFETAASVMLKGMTAEYLVRRCRPVKKGDVVLVHAAAGGVGQLLCQWAKALGAVVVGTVGRREKVAVTRGCDEVLVLGADDVVARAKALTGGRGVQVVYDSVGKDTIALSLDALAPRGMLVSFGQSSGMPPPIALASLGGPRSLYVTRPSMHAYTETRAELEASAQALFEVLGREVKVAPPTLFALKDADKAHRALEARQTTGSVVLLP